MALRTILMHGYPNKWLLILLLLGDKISANNVPEKREGRINTKNVNSKISRNYAY